jgi:hypothetical protein
MTTTERPIPPVVCAPWCVDGDGHTNEAFRGDQTCWGYDTYVDLSLEDVTRDKYGVYVQRIGATSHRRWGHTPCVYVHLDSIELSANRGTIDHALHLTAEEAMSLAAALVKAAEDIRGEPNGPAASLT